jgi:protein-S-isoprenylcysteine O-methyltransferase Ste14
MAPEFKGATDMPIILLETLFRWLGGLYALLTLASALVGIWRGTRRLEGSTSGRTTHVLRSHVFYWVTTILFLGFCILLWLPLPVPVSPVVRAVALVLGLLLYFPGMSFVLWGRLSLGRMYFVSTSFRAQLFADHQLITTGPYAIVRHPMYTGLIVSALGGLLLYRTWTVVFLLVISFGVLARAWREEQVLSRQFGENWREYSRHVPAFFPRLRRKRE